MNHPDQPQSPTMLEAELARLNEQILAVRRSISGVMKMLPPPVSTADQKDEEGSNPHRLPQLAYNLRRARDAIFPNLFADLSWDMLLDLYEARRLGRTITVSSACIASSGPPTTALRHLTNLERRGLIARQNCKEDERCVYVSLTPLGEDLMDEWINRASVQMHKWRHAM